jgi:hypothetical protein
VRVSGRRAREWSVNSIAWPRVASRLSGTRLEILRRRVDPPLFIR